jgi:hypothetical protein
MCSKLSRHELADYLTTGNHDPRRLTDDRHAPPQHARAIRDDKRNNSRYRTSSGKLRVGSSRIAGGVLAPAGGSGSYLIAATGNGHGAPGIARVLQQHTRMAVIVQDPAGRVIATSGVEERRGDSDAPWPARSLPDDGSHAVATFDVDRWVAVACPRGETLGSSSFPRL